MNSNFDQIPISNKNKNILITILTIVIVILFGTCTYLYLNNNRVNNTESTNKESQNCPVCETCKACPTNECKFIPFDKNKTDIAGFKNVTTDKILSMYYIDLVGGSKLFVDASGKATVDITTSDYINQGLTVKIESNKKYTINNSDAVGQALISSDDRGTIIFFLLENGTVEKLSLSNILENKFTPEKVAGISNAIRIEEWYHVYNEYTFSGSSVVAVLNDGSSKLIETFNSI